MRQRSEVEHNSTDRDLVSNTTRGHETSHKDY